MKICLFLLHFFQLFWFLFFIILYIFLFELRKIGKLPITGDMSLISGVAAVGFMIYLESCHEHEPLYTNRDANFIYI